MVLRGKWWIIGNKGINFGCKYGGSDLEDQFLAQHLGKHVDRCCYYYPSIVSTFCSFPVPLSLNHLYFFSTTHVTIVYSERSTLSQKDKVTYWGQIYKADVNELEDEDIVDDDLLQEKGIRVEINGSVMSGWGLEPCSTARFTMIEKTEDDMEYYDDNLEDDDDDDDDIEEYIPNLSDDIGSFE